MKRTTNQERARMSLFRAISYDYFCRAKNEKIPGIAEAYRLSALILRERANGIFPNLPQISDDAFSDNKTPDNGILIYWCHCPLLGNRLLGHVLVSTAKPEHYQGDTWEDYQTSIYFSTREGFRQAYCLARCIRWCDGAIRILHHWIPDIRAIQVGASHHLELKSRGDIRQNTLVISGAQSAA